MLILNYSKIEKAFQIVFCTYYFGIPFRHYVFEVKFRSYFRGNEPSVSRETTPTISISPPAKKKSPQKSEIPAWDVPQTITVRRSRAEPTDDQVF